MKICSKAVHGEKWGACNIFGVFVCAEGEKVKVHMTYIWDDQVITRLLVAWHVRVSTKVIPKVLTLK